LAWQGFTLTLGIVREWRNIENSGSTTQMPHCAHMRQAGQNRYNRHARRPAGPARSEI
jgi:hypothetical protein